MGLRQLTQSENSPHPALIVVPKLFIAVRRATDMLPAAAVNNFGGRVNIACEQLAFASNNEASRRAEKTNYPALV